MDNLTFGTPIKEPFFIAVCLDGKPVGAIRQEKDGSGFYYVPKFSTNSRGQTFQTVADVKQSLIS